MSSSQDRGPSRRDALLLGTGAVAGALAGSPLGAAAATKLTDPTPGRTQRLSRIAFGSCLRKSEEGGILEKIADSKPEVMLWLGDNIYADTIDPLVMRQKYGLLRANPRFQRLFGVCPNLATWDDHDYGQDNAGLAYPMKHEARESFFEHWKIDPRSPRRQHEGVYDAVIAGPPGREVQIILLDNRWNRAPKERPDGPVLGNAQWRWLEAQLGKRAAVRIIASGIQVVNGAHKGRERWDQHPAERERLFALIRKRRAAGVIFVSGDTHRAELNVERDVLGYHAFDLTSSSLDQPLGGTLVRGAQTFWDGYNGPNFGAIEVDWHSADPGIRLQIESEDRTRPVLSHWLRLSELSPVAPVARR